MRQTKCPRCGGRKQVVAYRRDDPLLECGHVLTIDEQLERDEMKLMARDFLHHAALLTMKLRGVGYAKALEMFDETYGGDQTGPAQ